MTKREYLAWSVASLHKDALEEVLNRLGADDWELVAMTPAGYAVLKRPASLG